MERKLVGFIVVFLLLGIVGAVEVKDVDGEEIPGKLKTLIGNQRVNVYLDDSFSFGFEVEKGIINYSEEKLEKATLEIYSSQVVIDSILESKDPVSGILEAYNEGEILIERKTIMNKIKFFFLKWFI